MAEATNEVAQNLANLGLEDNPFCLIARMYNLFQVSNCAVNKNESQGWFGFIKFHGLSLKELIALPNFQGKST